MNPFLDVFLAVCVFVVPVILLILLIKSVIRRADDKRAAVYETWQSSQDQTLRAAGHTEPYIESTRKIRDLKAKRSGTIVGAFLGAVLCIAVLIAYPPFGLFVTFWYIIAIVRFSVKSHKESQILGLEVDAETSKLPER